jgi:hypothetical protein
MTPEVAEAIARATKRGGAGAALAFTGYLLARGGTLKTDDQGNLLLYVRPELAKAAGHVGLTTNKGRWMLLGRDISSTLGHTPIMNPLAMGVMMQEHGAAGVPESMLDTWKHTPAAGAINDAVFAGISTRSLGKAAGGMARDMTIPQLVQMLARGQDSAKKRYPRGPVEAYKVGIPGLREQVPSRKMTR